MSIEPFKKKKVKKEEDDNSTTLSLGSNFITSASGAPDEKIGVGEMTIEPEEKPKTKPPDQPKHNIYEEYLRNAFIQEYSLGFEGYRGPFRQHTYEAERIIHVSLAEAIRRELELCRNGNRPIGFHVERMLDYFKQQSKK